MLISTYRIKRRTYILLGHCARGRDLRERVIRGDVEAARGTVPRHFWTVLEAARADLRRQLMITGLLILRDGTREKVLSAW
jgi:hypothetical protein